MEYVKLCIVNEFALEPGRSRERAGTDSCTKRYNAEFIVFFIQSAIMGCEGMMMPRERDGRDMEGSRSFI